MIKSAGRVSSATISSCIRFFAFACSVCGFISATNSGSGCVLSTVLFLPGKIIFPPSRMMSKSSGLVSCSPLASMPFCSAVSVNPITFASFIPETGSSSLSMIIGIVSSAITSGFSVNSGRLSSSSSAITRLSNSSSASTIFSTTSITSTGVSKRFSAGSIAFSTELFSFFAVILLVDNAPISFSKFFISSACSSNTRMGSITCLKLSGSGSDSMMSSSLFPISIASRCE